MSFPVRPPGLLGVFETGPTDPLMARDATIGPVQPLIQNLLRPAAAGLRGIRARDPRDGARKPLW